MLIGDKIIIGFDRKIGKSKWETKKRHGKLVSKIWRIRRVIFIM